MLPERTERLIELIDEGRLECIVCLSVITAVQPVFSCPVCHSILHLDCFSDWITASHSNCPACSSPLSEDVCGGKEYRCWCGKQVNPSGSHACSSTCGKILACKHTCTLKCHPGACQRCERMGNPISCFCGDLVYEARCGDTSISCGGVCNQKLNCGIHSCVRECHKGECLSCEETVDCVCYCSRQSRHTFVCGSSEILESSRYSCLELCDKYA